MNNGRIHKIKEKIYYAIHLKLLSPLSISNGEADVTDSDVILDGEGQPFIPGTSIAGAFRNNLGQEKDKKGVMGYSKGEDGMMSQLFIQDVYLKGGKMSVRDRVRLNDEKTVEPGGKFDMEIVETGASGWLFMELNVREGIEEAESFAERVNTVLCNLQSGEIRIGANKNRGFGRMEITEIYEKHFRKENVDKWLEFLEDTRCIEKYRDGDKKVSFDDWAGKAGVKNSGYLKITVPLELAGGISIRKYSTQPGKADYEHITCNRKPVIPGSSWNGAIRSRVLCLLKDLDVKSAPNYVDEWFGYVDGNAKAESDSGQENKESERPKAKQSKVVFGESIIEDAKELPVTRTRINRFDASAAGLYQELSYFGGTTKLEIMVDNRMDNKDAFLALLDFVIKDIQNGYLAVGGQTAVGRGLFKKSGEVVYSDSKVNLESCKRALFKLMKG